MKQADFNETAKLLNRYKLPFSKSILSKSADEAAKSAKKIGFPVVMKISSPDIIHKSDVGGVIVGIENEIDAKKAYETIIKKAKSKFSKAKVTGVLTQKMEQGTEVIIGAKKDAQFGPVIMFGLGGIFVEVMKDTSLRVAPVDRKEAIEMIKEIKAYPVISGARGRKPVNISAIADIIMKISKLAESKNVLELDLNPVIVDEKKATIVDARIIIE